MVSNTGNTKQAIGTDEFDLPLPPEGLDCHAHKDTGIQWPLFLVGKLHDAGCDILFQKHWCLFFKGGRIIIEARQDGCTGLHSTPKGTNQCTQTELDIDMPEQALNAFQDQTIPQLMQCPCACAGFPPKATWITAMNQECHTTWPGLTASRVRKWLPQIEETDPGHLKQTRQGLHSTSEGGDNHTSKDEDNTKAQQIQHTVHTRGKQ